VLLIGFRYACAVADGPVAAGTAVELTLVGGPALDPNAQGRPSPVEVRIFQLSAPREFEAAHFDSLFRPPQSTTRANALAQDDFMLRPGEIHEHKRNVGSGVQALGVVAAFHDLDQAV